jgi:hypothetical protein
MFQEIVAFGTVSSESNRRTDFGYDGMPKETASKTQLSRHRLRIAFAACLI